MQVRADQEEVVHQPYQTTAGKSDVEEPHVILLPPAAAYALLHLRPVAVPALFSDALQEGVLHVAVAETAEQTGHDGALGNPPALPVKSAKDTNS